MRWGWMAIDALAIGLFVLTGLRSHGTLDEFGLQRNLPAFLVGWFVAALWRASIGRSPRSGRCLLRGRWA
jgi:hypothetical protein